MSVYRGFPKLPIRLTIVINALERGGAERHLLQVLPRLSDYGFAAEVFCLHHKGELAPEMERRGITVHGPSFPRSGIIMLVLQLIVGSVALFFFLLRNRPDIVHLFLPVAYIMGAPAAVLARCRIRLMSRRNQNNYQKQFILTGVIERLWHRGMSAMFGNSRNVVTQLAREGIPENKLHLIYNGVDLSAFGQSIPRSVARDRLGLGQGAMVFVIVANLITYKGHADLLEAFARVKEKLPGNWVLLCAGRDDGIGSYLQGMVEDLGLTQRIHWLGSVKDVPSLLAAADVALLTSHEEGFSNALIEYMAMGLPVIATNVGGNAEAVLDGQTGVVVPPRNPDALGQAILKLAADPSLRETYGAAGRERAREHYSLEACVGNYVRIYRKILADHGIH